MNADDDTVLMDFYEQNANLFLYLKPSWYAKIEYGGPYRKLGSLREAIRYVMMKHQKRKDSA